VRASAISLSLMLSWLNRLSFAIPKCDEKRRKWHGRLSGYRSSDLWIDHERNRESAGQAHANGADRRSARILADMSAQGAKPRRDGGGNARAQIGVDQTLGKPLQCGREARNFRQQEYIGGAWGSPA
jgi:hypothetical protein